MKADIHPDYHEITVQMTDGTKFKTRSTWGKAGETLILDVDPKTHPAWSDGKNTIAEMAAGCIEGGYSYFVISDHSKSAFYAQGMKEDKITEQHEEIEKLNKQLFPFKIYKSIFMNKF